MFRPKNLPRAVMALSTTVLLASAAAPVADGAQRKARSDYAPVTQTGAKPFDAQIARATFSLEPPESTASTNLPAKKENVNLISRFEPTSGPGGSIEDGQIADVAVHKDVAYLNSWSLPEGCERGGFFAADISDPASPKDLGFVPALPDSYHGEGAHVISTNSVGFKGDLLIVNNEPCPGVATDDDNEALAPGGFDLYDVSDPRNIKPFVKGFGDTGPDVDPDDPEAEPGSLTGDDPFANSSHSSFLWEDDGRIYAVTVDNYEVNDVDVFDVTNPAAPTPVGEFDLVRVAEEQGYSPGTDGILDGGAYGDQVFLHDMVVKEIDGRMTMLADYWDAGYVRLDVEDPAAPEVVGDSSFDGPDPLTGVESAEGNGHQGEFSADNKYILAADEDFAPFRLEAEVTTGSAPGIYPVTESADQGVRKIVDFDDRTLGGDRTVYVGTACSATPDDPDTPEDESVPADPVPAPPADDGDSQTERIAVIERGGAGTCTFAAKAQNAEDAGWDGYAVFNNADRPDGDPLVTPTVEPATLPGVYLRRADALRALFGITDDSTPTKGTEAERLVVTAKFDGWGYAHLYRNTGGKMEKIDDYAIQESLDPRFASGFGDLSIHEFATDPETNLAYSAYYAGGLRVLSFGEGGLKEEGAYIDDRGNNFWGVEQFTDQAGNRLIAASDRDFGLYIMRYTGPGAVNAPVPGPAPAPGGGAGGTPGGGTPGGGTPTPGTPVTPRMVISGNAIRLSRKGFALIRVGCPAAVRGTCKGSVRLASGRRRLGSKSFTIAAGRKATVKVKLPSAGRRILRRRSLRVQVTAGAVDEAGTKLTNTRRITVREAKGR